MVQSIAVSAPGTVSAILGPTNTGKTHLAIERMLGHASGMIGLPLRLLAREIYDRVVAEKGTHAVALITGEEKILPAHPSYWVCTVESMPLTQKVDFLAVDEIQLAADPGRGHIFTDRLLHARGRLETIFLGAETIRSVLRRLLPEARYDSRPRLSKLLFAGEKKLTRLPRRTAIVAFSAAEVYTIAELVRRQLGGAAVVLGALSPRTRNAQVALYQSGDVDYLVATDAIGMGLNMSVDHVAFAAVRKFDGRFMRDLRTDEIGQIAGRAGRYLNNGSFGVTAGAPAWSVETIENIEAHRYNALRHLHWRNRALSFASISGLLHSLRQPAQHDMLIDAPQATDFTALQALVNDPEIKAVAHGRAALRLLWDVCQIPDFRKTMAEHHHGLLKQIYLALSSEHGVIPSRWFADSVQSLDRVDGDIDTLSGRIAHIRTWAYVANRQDWIDNGAHWRAVTRAIEDRLSDALHTALTQRFVDRRTSILMRGLAERRNLQVSISEDQALLVEGHYVGHLEGLRFVYDSSAETIDRQTVRAAANRVLRGAIQAQAEKLLAAPPTAFHWGDDGCLTWQDAAVAKIVKGSQAHAPRLHLLCGEELSAAMRERLLAHLTAWVGHHIEETLAPLFSLQRAPLQGAARGLAYQLVEALGVLSRKHVAEALAAIPVKYRRTLRELGVVIGDLDVFMPALLRPAAVRLRLHLWRIWQGLEPIAPPKAGLVSFTAQPDFRNSDYHLCGFRRAGPLAIRIDILNRLARRLYRQEPMVQPDHEMISLLGCRKEDLVHALAVLGYRPQSRDGQVVYCRRRKPSAKRPAKRAKKAKVKADSPFAGLAAMKFSGHD